jgi:signal peptidase I
MDTDEQHAGTTERDGSTVSRQGRWRLSRSARLGGAAAALLLALVLVSLFVARPFAIPSGSMEPALQPGDRVLVNELAYAFGGTPRRGDVVVFDGRGSFVPVDDPAAAPVRRLLHGAGAALGLTDPLPTDYVKRVVGVGGDRVRCCDERGRIEVNGEPLREPYLYPGDAPSTVPFDVLVPDGRLWVMGDHRSGSADSRAHLGDPGGGMVPLDRVVGRAELVSWPPDRWGVLEGAATHG